MCGSGTFLIEAALIAQGRPAGLHRASWPFLSWPDFSVQAWRDTRQEAAEADRSAQRPSARLLGNDIHEGALSLAQRS